MKGTPVVAYLRDSYARVMDWLCDEHCWIQLHSTQSSMVVLSECIATAATARHDQTCKPQLLPSVSAHCALLYAALSVKLPHLPAGVS
jgi:hypothetical protein